MRRHLLALIEANPELEVDWVVLASPGDRAEEARASAASFLAGAATRASRCTSSETDSCRT